MGQVIFSKVGPSSHQRDRRISIMNVSPRGDCAVKSLWGEERRYYFFDSIVIMDIRGLGTE